MEFKFGPHVPEDTQSMILLMEDTIRGLEGYPIRSGRIDFKALRALLDSIEHLETEGYRATSRFLLAQLVEATFCGLRQWDINVKLALDELAGS